MGELSSFCGSALLRKGQASDEKVFKVNMKSCTSSVFQVCLRPPDPRQMAVNYSCQDFGMSVTVCMFFHLGGV